VLAVDGGLGGVSERAAWGSFEGCLAAALRESGSAIEI
jgi:hypothetical protein